MDFLFLLDLNSEAISSRRAEFEKRHREIWLQGNSATKEKLISDEILKWMEETFKEGLTVLVRKIKKKSSGKCTKAIVTKDKKFRFGVNLYETEPKNGMELESELRSRYGSYFNISGGELK